MTQSDLLFNIFNNIHCNSDVYTQTKLTILTTNLKRSFKIYFKGDIVDKSKYDSQEKLVKKFMEALQDRLRDIACQEDSLDVQASMFIKPLCLFKAKSDDSPTSRKVHLSLIIQPTRGAQA